MIMEHCITLAEKLGCKILCEGHYLGIEDASDEQYDEIRDAIVEVDARLRRMAPQRHKLTELFENNSE